MGESLKIQYDDSLSTGSRLIDVQHKYLIDIINELAEAIEKGTAASAIAEILNLLRFYTEWHFEREELCMERYRCPVAAANKSAHATFITTFEGFRAEYREGGGSEEIARRMYATLTTWLVSHIQKVDGQIAPCVHDT